MKFASILLTATLISFAFVSCNEKKQSTDIITHKAVKKEPAHPTKMQDYEHPDNVEWLGKTYKVSISRHSDTQLPIITDESGSKYYDNKITVIVSRPDGTEFFNRTFTKEDFKNQIDESYLSKSALLGMVIDSAEGDNLKLAASVGAPDVLSDEYVPLIISISRLGNVSIQKDNRLDSSDNSQENEDDGV